MSQVSLLSPNEVTVAPMRSQACYLVSWEFAPPEGERLVHSWGVSHLGCSKNVLSKLARHGFFCPSLLAVGLSGERIKPKSSSWGQEWEP